MLEDFEFDRVIGRGGAGVVWLATHRPNDVRVALKFLRSRRSGAHIAELNTELEAVARLNHEGIVPLLNAGEVGEKPASHLRVEEGDSYLVYPFIDGPTLEPYLGRVDWALARRIVLAALDALAHAHARKVIHRDIKPANILMLDEVPRITDFGIARHYGGKTEDFQTLATSQGTIRYMSPEQIEGRQRDQTAVTDLYAMGCVAYVLLTGEHAFGSQVAEAALAKFQGDSPDIRDKGGTDGLQNWFRHMLAPDFRDRFPCAADAAAAFARLEHQNIDQARPPDTSERIESELTVKIEVRKGEYSSIHPTHSHRDELPQTWRESHTPEKIPSGMGAGILNYREVPFYGREHERDLLWGHLLSTLRERRARHICIQGALGVGKTRLARWLMYKAHELGAAFYLEFEPSRFAGPFQALGVGLARHFGCIGLSFEEARTRLVEAFKRLAADGFAETEDPLIEIDAASIAGLVAADSPIDDMLSPDVASAVLKRVLRRMVNERPLVVLVDDVDPGNWWSEQLSKFDRLDELPVLFLSTCRNISRCRCIGLDGLDEKTIRRIVESLVGLSPKAIDRVIESAAGNPLMALQIVEDWVIRDVLKLTDEGLDAENSSAVVDIASAFATRLRYALNDADRDVKDSASILAALGGRVELDLWRDACAEAELQGESVLDLLQSAGLLEVNDRVVGFTHPIISEQVLEWARERDRLSLAHRACFDVFRKQETSISRDLLMANHALGAAQWKDARDLIQRSIRALMKIGHSDEALLQLPRLIRAASEISSWASRRAAVFEEVIRIWSLQRQKPDEVPHEKLPALKSRAEALDDQRLVGDVLLVWSLVERDRSNRGSYEKMKLSRLAYERAGATRLHYSALAGEGWLQAFLREHTESHQKLSLAIEYFDRTGDLVEAAQARHGRSFVKMQLGQFEAAKADVETAIAQARKLNVPMTLAGCFMGLGEFERLEGSLVAAHRHYREASKIYREINVRSHLNALGNLMMTEMGIGDATSARLRVREVLDLPGHEAISLHVHLVEWILDHRENAAQTPWRKTDEELVLAAEPDRDIAWLLEYASDAAATPASERLREIAASIWRQLGRDDRVEALRVDPSTAP